MSAGFWYRLGRGRPNPTKVAGLHREGSCEFGHARISCARVVIGLPELGALGRYLGCRRHLWTVRPTDTLSSTIAQPRSAGFGSARGALRDVRNPHNKASSGTRWFVVLGVSPQPKSSHSARSVFLNKQTVLCCCRTGWWVLVRPRQQTTWTVYRRWPRCEVKAR